jgi:co-chaperonin GroES (HSP10)
MHLLTRHSLLVCSCASCLSRTQKTSSGLFLPTSSTNTPLPEATVIAVGPGATDKEGKIVPMSVQSGDRVLLPGWGGNAIKVGEEVCTRPGFFARPTYTSLARRLLVYLRCRHAILTLRFSVTQEHVLTHPPAGVPPLPGL